MLGPWVAKNATMIASKGSKDRSKTSAGGASGDHIVTIGKKSHRLERLAKDGRGWTNIDTDSEEMIVEPPGSGQGAVSTHS